GQPRAAEAPEREAAELFERQQYRERALRLRLRSQALTAWERGRPGEALAVCREALPGFRDLNMPGEAALAALLVALIMCDVDDTVDGKQRERYDGELYTLLARLYLERGQPEETRAWLERADEWFARDPKHRAAPEWQATKLALDWTEARRLEKEPAADGAGK